MRFKKIQKYLKNLQDKVDLDKIKLHLEGATEQLDLKSYYTKAVLSKTPGKVDFSLSEVFKLKAQPQHKAEDFYKTALDDGKQYLFFGDTNHTDTDIHEFFFGDDNAKRFVENGIKHVFVEYQPEFQDIFDACAEGDLNPDDFVDALRARAKTLSPDSKPIDNPIAEQSRAAQKTMARAVRYWHQNGIKTHCPDDRSSFTKEELASVRDNYKMMYKALRFAKDTGTEKPVVHQRLMISYVFNSTARPQSSKMKPKSAVTIKELQDMQNAQVSQDFMTKRMQDDHKLSKTIAGLAGNEPSAILFGAGHGDRKNGLGDLLGDDKTLRVNIHTSMEMYAEKGDIITRRRQENYRSPDYVHIVEKNKVYKTKGLHRNS